MDNITSSRDLPIGTIITSYLNFEQFNAATKNNEKSPGGIWTSSKSKWAPCDGRPVPNSKFQKLTSQVNIPDLRGMFLRGLNKFDPYQPVNPPSTERADPDDRIVGSFQADGFQNHSHKLAGNNGGEDGTSVGLWPDKGQGIDGRYARSGMIDGYVGNSGVITETRPNNVAIYYYVRVN